MIDIMLKAATQVLQRPGNRASFAKQGMTGGGSPEALAATIAADTRR